MNLAEIKQLAQEASGIMTRIAGGEAAQAAAHPQPEQTPETLSKGVNPDDEFAHKEARVGGNALAKSFLKLARTHKNFHHLGADRVLEDPRGYLRRKRAGTEQYEISDIQLELMIQTLLSKSAGEDAEGISDDNVRVGLLSAASKGAFGANSMIVQRALDSTSGAVLVRTDIEPMLYEAYLREFPASEMIGSVRANGLLHSYDVRTAIPTAQTLNDIGDFSGAFSQSTFVRKANSNIAIIAAPVSIGLKLALAVQQSGMTSFNLEGSNNLEVVGAMFAIARKNQTLMLQGNYSTAAKTLNDEEGLTDDKGFDGLRTILKGASTSITKATGETLRSLLRRAASQIRNAGGAARNIIAIVSEGAEIAIDTELEEFYRIVNSRPAGGVDMNLSANGLRLGSKYLSQIVSVPADAQSSGVGHYTYAANPTEDMYVLDTTGIQLAYLGSPSPTILELPMGYDNRLARCFVPFLMNGLVVHIADFQRKIRIPRQTV